MEQNNRLPQLNVEEIKAYNKSVREQKDKASKIRAEINFNNGELERLCKELTAELGVEVTVDNVEEIYNQYVEKINSTLNSGKEILKRIEDGNKEIEESSNTTGLNLNNSLDVPNIENVPNMVGSNYEGIRI